ncbi:MAG: two-component system response regulator UvrY [Gammaproteobacteria bacterium CG22_combo_CG10-13_8_21_14_all_40_8]|nr:MAG: two-component system response regulator UvrY [Gammaproteobacteria bacterium CG22_combo_CG10-13_8_21_14_all_40_8]
MINILIVDDHDLVRFGVQRLLSDIPGIEVVAEADCGETAISLMRKISPDLVLLDANMPGIGGLETARRMIRYAPDVKIIILSAHAEHPLPSKFLDIGVKGYITKSADIKEMERAIRHVNSGQMYLAGEIAQSIAMRSLKNSHENPFEQLSEREIQVMQMLTRGMKVPEISDVLCLSPKTVNSYRYRLFEKLSVNGDVELTHLALRYGIIDSNQF